MNVLLKNLHWYTDEIEGKGDIRVADGRIRTLGSGLRPRRGEHVVDLDGHIAFPGLINAHDHLSLNLFPRRGNPPYTNFYQWARDIYNPHEEVQREIMSVGLRDRLLWGGYKNLVGGVTTVVHHDPYARGVFTHRFPVGVVRRMGWAHSLGYGKYLLPKAYWSRIRRRPFVIHAAEGSDSVSHAEIDRLDAMGVLAPNAVLVHALALQPRHIQVLAETGCATVWCPASNQFLYHASSPVALLRRSGVPVALGTDSTLSGSPTLLHEMRAANAAGMASADELFRMVTTAAAGIFNLNDGQGTLREGGRADIIVLPGSSAAPADTLLDGEPVFVMRRGLIRLAQREIAARLGLVSTTNHGADRPIWLCGDIAALKRRIAARVRPQTLAQNPLWRMPIFADQGDLADHHEPHALTIS